MAYLDLSFKLVSVIFASAAIFTGGQALLDPVAFSNSFGIPIDSNVRAGKDATVTKTHPQASERSSASTRSYVSLMGVRQLATGLTISVFAYQNKWSEVATILAIIGVVVAGTDGYHLSSTGKRGLGIYHALPGTLIAALAVAKLSTVS